MKEIEKPEALNIDEFSTLHEGIALQNLNQDHIIDLDNVDTMVFQLGRVERSMTMRQFILALGLYTPEDKGMLCSNHFMNRALETGPTTTTPLSRHSGMEKVTLDDLFLLHSMDGGARVDVPWLGANFFTDKAKGFFEECYFRTRDFAVECG
ncbi:hypothetical protein Tco_0062052 [Tanacetum coccineum]